MKHSALLRIVVPALAGLVLLSQPLHAQRALQKNPTTGALIEGFKSGAYTIEISATGTLKWNSGSTLDGASLFRTSAGLAIGSDVQAYSANLTTFAGIAPSANIQSLLAAADYSAARTALGLAIGTDIQAYSANLTTFAGIAPSANIQSLLAAADYSAARTALGLVIGTNVQAYSANLTTFAGIAPSANIQSLLAAADYSAARTALGLVIGTNVQAYNATELPLTSGVKSTLLTTALLQWADTTNGGYLILHAPDLSGVGEFDLYVPAVDGTLISTGNLSAVTATGTITSGTWNGTDLGLAYIAQGGATDGQVMRWNNTAGTWEPGTVSGGGLTIGATTTSGAASGDILTSDGPNLQKLTPGTGVSTWLATPTLANLNSAVSDADLATLAANTFTTTQTIAVSGAVVALNVTEDATSAYKVTTNAAGNVRLDLGKRGAHITTTDDYNSVFNGYFGAVAGQNSGGINFTGGNWALSNNADCIAYRDAAGHWSQRNSTNAQRFSVFNTYTSSTSHEAFTVDFQTTANTARIGTVKGSGGGSAREWLLQYDSVEKARVTSAGFQIGTRGSAISAVATVVKAAHDCASIAAGATETTTATITGAAAGSTFIPSPIYHEGLVISAARTAADTVTITFYNPTAGAIDASAVDVRVTEIAF